MGLSLCHWDWIIGGAALAGNLLLGLWFAMRARKSGSSDDFFLAGRRSPGRSSAHRSLPPTSAPSTWWACRGDAYRYGLCAGADELTTAICLGFAAAVLFPYYMQNQVFTIPEFLELRYNRQRGCSSPG